MDESYPGSPGEGRFRFATAPLAVSERSAETALAQELLAQLLPGVDSGLLFRALLAEREPVADGATRVGAEGDLAVAMRELDRVRAQLAIGAGVGPMRHAFNNPLTALLAEAQLLELEPLGNEQRAAVRRILELARRLVALSRRLGGAATETEATGG